MKSYPSIPALSKSKLHFDGIAFDKLDGSNIRFEWSKKRGWYKFGSRNNMIDVKNEQLGKSISIFLSKYGDDLERVFRNEKDFRHCDSFIVFGEYFGPNSFAGYHFPDDPMDVVIFDVNPYKKGILSPRDFIRKFGHLHIPNVIYEGNLNEIFIENVRSNIYGLKEGVVFKGMNKNQVIMTKVKTREWLQQLIKKCGYEAALFET